MLELFNNAGIVKWPLAFCSLLAVAIILERFWTLARLRQAEDDAYQKIKGGGAELDRPDIIGAPVAQILQSLSPLRGESQETVAQAGDIALALQRQRLRRFLGTLATIGSTSPFIGLFGTVLGVLKAFKGMAQSGLSGDKMAGGIAEALSATAFGLLVAVPSVIAYNYFVGRVTALLLHIQSHVALAGPKYLNAAPESAERELVTR